jgi:asparagine synthase (glutamine-hydrolysing)
MTHYMRNQLLRDADWAGMAHSLEIRVPFLDVDLLRAVALASTRIRVSRKNLFRDIHDAETAKPIFGRRKTSFMVPLRQWAGDTGGAEPSMHRGLRGWGRAIYSRFAP